MTLIMMMMLLFIKIRNNFNKTSTENSNFINHSNPIIIHNNSNTNKYIVNILYFTN